MSFSEIVEQPAWSPGPPGLYLVESPSCHIPALDALPTTLRRMKLVHHVELPPCAKVPPLSSVRRVLAEAFPGGASPGGTAGAANDSWGTVGPRSEGPRWAFVLRINASLMKKHRPAAAYCCYSVLKRETVDESILFTTDFDATVDNRYR